MAVIGAFFAAGTVLGTLAIFGGASANGELGSQRRTSAGGTGPGPANPSVIVGSPSVTVSPPSEIPGAADAEAAATASNIHACLVDEGLDVSGPSEEGHYGGVGMTVDLGGPDVVQVIVFASELAAADAADIALNEYQFGVIIPSGNVLLVYEIGPTVDTRMQIEGCALPLPS